ncbi:hypothetical protein [Streptomyces dangxiongensis]|uniref:hypothetical protein n=1 Tax=Streptomyces dangxiongensis TaxID=1442032 RepID=UPI0013CE5C4A|nr:hypothetical protein [Streptomyces dangxiongensis]
MSDSSRDTAQGAGRGVAERGTYRRQVLPAAGRRPRGGPAALFAATGNRPQELDPPVEDEVVIPLPGPPN